MMSNGITSKTTGRKHQTKYNVTCESSNLIYCIECKTCKIQYVGQTKRKIKFRLGEHLRSIRNNTKKMMYQHISTNVNTMEQMMYKYTS